MSEVDDITSFLKDLKSSEEVIEPEYSQDNEEVKVENPNTGQSSIIKRDVVSDPRVLPIFSTDPNSDRYYQNFKSNNFHYILSDGIKVDYGFCSINDRVQIKEIMSRSDYLTNYDYYSLPFYVIGGRQLPVESTQISMTQVTNSVTKTVSDEVQNVELWLNSPGNDSSKCVALLEQVFSIDHSDAEALVSSCPTMIQSFDSSDKAQSALSKVEADENYDLSMDFDQRVVYPVQSSTSEAESQSQSQTTESYTASYVKYHLFTDKGEVMFTVDQYSVPQINAVKDLNEWFLDIINHIPMQSISFIPYTDFLSSDFKYIRANLIQIGNDIYTLKVGYTQFIDFYRFLSCLRKYKDQDKQNCFVSYLSDKVYSE